MAFRSVATLSRRESEVAELVGDGLSNREIAGRLFISERTVEGHVAQICAKLGFRSRVQIATWVASEQSRGAPEDPPTPPFRVVNRPARLPARLLAVMAAGVPLGIAAAAYPWVSGASSQASTPLKLLVTTAALLFLVIPGVAALALDRALPWGEGLAIGGLISLGSLVLALAAATLAADTISGRGFRAADYFEFAYALAVVPLLLIHFMAAGTVLRRTPGWKLLTTLVAGFWILRYGYGLSLSALVLWLIWNRKQGANEPSR